jgi:hypothetical protein
MIKMVNAKECFMDAINGVGPDAVNEYILDIKDRKTLENAKQIIRNKLKNIKNPKGWEDYINDCNEILSAIDSRLSSI